MAEKRVFQMGSLKKFYGAEKAAVTVTTKSGATYSFELPDKNGFRVMHHSGITFKVKIVSTAELNKDSLLAIVGYIEVGKCFFYMPEDDEYGYWYKSGPVAKIELQSKSKDQ